MSGILDNKTRMIDTIITREGRRQMAAGDLRISFVSFTDADTFYEVDASSGSADPAERLMFESSNLPQDSITFEADDSGKLVSFRGSVLGITNGRVLSGSSDQFLSIVTGSVFGSTADQLLLSSIDNFQKLYAITTEDVFFDRSDEFQLTTNEIMFTINDHSPISEGEPKVIKIDKIESIFQDRRLSHLPNFQHLPPVNKPTVADPDGTPLGNFPVIGERVTEYTYPELIRELERKPFQVVDFVQTTQMSNIVAQIFEQSVDTLRKLEVIDFGEFLTGDSEAPSKHVFFVGKVFIDSFGSQTFVNMFTLVLE